MQVKRKSGNYLQNGGEITNLDRNKTRWDSLFKKLFF